MFARKLDHVDRQPVTGDTSGPLRAQDLVVATHHIGSWCGRESGQRTRQRREIEGLRPKAVKGRIGNGPITVSVERLASDVAIRPYLPELLVGLAEPRFVQRVEHLQLVGRLTEQAASDVRHEGAQIHQTSYGAPISDQWNRVAAK
jgi:hypothetical protein